MIWVYPLLFYWWICGDFFHFLFQISRCSRKWSISFFALFWSFLLIACWLLWRAPLCNEEVSEHGGSITFGHGKTKKLESTSYNIVNINTRVALHKYIFALPHLSHWRWKRTGLDSSTYYRQVQVGSWFNVKMDLLLRKPKQTCRVYRLP